MVPALSYKSYSVTNTILQPLQWYQHYPLNFTVLPALSYNLYIVTNITLQPLQWYQHYPKASTVVSNYPTASTMA